MNRTAYSYAASVKSDLSDELVNTYFVRPLAGFAVRLLFNSRITPNQLTLAAICAGCGAAFFYLEGDATRNVLGGMMILLKDILDSADGQLARARSQFSRLGRFLDSIGDLFVNLIVFAAITFAMYRGAPTIATILLGVAGFIGTTLRVSYHVFYHTSFLHLKKTYEGNRIIEEINNDDLQSDATTLKLQRAFQLLYGWQDRLVMKVDGWCKCGVERNQQNNTLWFADAIGLRLSGLIGMGTELFVLMLFSIINRLDAYLLVNVLVGNAVLCTSVFYRKTMLARRLILSSSPSHS